MKIIVLPYLRSSKAEISFFLLARGITNEENMKQRKGEKERKKRNEDERDRKKLRDTLYFLWYIYIYIWQEG